MARGRVPWWPSPTTAAASSSSAVSVLPAKPASRPAWILLRTRGRPISRLRGAPCGSRDAGGSVAPYVAVHVVPALRLAHEAAGFLQAPGRAATEAIAGHEFHDGVVVVDDAVRAHVEPQPRRRGMLRGEDRCVGPRGGEPGGQQVVFAPEYVRAVAREHQRLGRGRGGAGMQRSAAARIAVWMAARAGRHGGGGLWVGGSQRNAGRAGEGRRAPLHACRCQMRQKLFAGMVTLASRPKPAASASASTASASRMPMCGAASRSERSNAALLWLVKSPPTLKGP